MMRSLKRKIISVIIIFLMVAFSAGCAFVFSLESGGYAFAVGEKITPLSIPTHWKFGKMAPLSIFIWTAIVTGFFSFLLEKIISAVFSVELFTQFFYGVIFSTLGVTFGNVIFERTLYICVFASVLTLAGHIVGWMRHPWDY